MNMSLRRFLIIIPILFLSLSAQAQVLESHKAFMREMRYFLDSRGLSPQLKEDNQIRFKYSGNTYYMALRGREVNPYVLLIYAFREYDDIFTKEMVSTIAPSEGLAVLPSEYDFRIQAENHVFDAESIKYVFNTVMNNLILYEKRIDDLGASQAEYIRQDDEKWKSIDKNDEAAILSYINESTVYQKRHLTDARIMYDILHSHNAAVEDAESKIAFAKDLYIRGEARSETGSKRVYDLLTEASRYVDLDKQAQDILSEINEDRMYQQFKQAPDLAAAEEYLRAYPQGLYKRQVEDWVSKHTKHARKAKQASQPKQAKQAKQAKQPKEAKQAKQPKQTKQAKPVQQTKPVQQVDQDKPTLFHVGLGASYFGTRKGARPTGILEFKLGDSFQRVNWIVGASGRPDIVKGEGTRSVFVNTALKFNLFPITDKCRFYIAPGGGYDILKESIEYYGRAGLCFKHLDVFGQYQTVAYYPTIAKVPAYNYYTGVSVVWYF